MRHLLTRIAFLFLLTAPLCVPAGVSAQDNGAQDKEVDAQIDELLNAHHHGAPADVEWSELGPEAEAKLIAVATDKKTRATVRSRAIVALRHFDSDETRTAVRQLITEESPEIIVRKSLVTLAELDPASLELVTPWLEHEDANVRMAAVDALAVIGGEEALQILEARYDNEKSGPVMKRLDGRMSKIKENIAAQ